MTKNLEYKIGVVEINKDNFDKEGDEAHKFLVYRNEKVILIYILGSFNHARITEKFGLKHKGVLGGGRIYLSKSGSLIFEGKSFLYGSVPREVAEKFGTLIKDEIKKEGIEAKEVLVQTEDRFAHSFWEKIGFLDSEEAKNF